jgi:hypothetical protein
MMTDAETAAARTTVNRLVDARREVVEEQGADVPEVLVAVHIFLLQVEDFVEPVERDELRRYMEATRDAPGALS